MCRIRSLTGMPVICRRQKIGHLVQADLSDDLKRMEGIWVDSGLKGTRYIPAEQLGMIGRMAVIADSRGLRRRCSPKPLLHRAISTDGSRIGAIVGAEVDELSFLVDFLELSRGIWDDLAFGRIPVDRFSVQQGSVIVSASTEANRKEDQP